MKILDFAECMASCCYTQRSHNLYSRIRNSANNWWCWCMHCSSPHIRSSCAS